MIKCGKTKILLLKKLKNKIKKNKNSDPRKIIRNIAKSMSEKDRISFLKMLKDFK